MILGAPEPNEFLLVFFRYILWRCDSSSCSILPWSEVGSCGTPPLFAGADLDPNANDFYEILCIFRGVPSKTVRIRSEVILGLPLWMVGHITYRCLCCGGAGVQYGGFNNLQCIVLGGYIGAGSTKTVAGTKKQKNKEAKQKKKKKNKIKKKQKNIGQYNVRKRMGRGSCCSCWGDVQ